MRRQWTINGRFLFQPVTGVQRYASEIVRALDDLICQAHPLADGLDIQLLVPPGSHTDLDLKTIPIRPVGFAGGQIWEQVILPRHVCGGLLSFCNTGPLSFARQIVCIHDLNTRMAPESYATAFRLYYRALMPAIGRSACKITTVSQYSASQLVAFGVAPRAKISVIPNGYEHALRWRPEHSPQTRAACGPNTIVLLGSPAPHKNVHRILDLAPQFANHGLKIAVAGAGDPNVFKKSGRTIEAENLTWLGRVEDAALAALLKDSLCLAFPSLTEGFGLPPLEAMAMGCPVVVSNRASLPEVCGGAALYADPSAPQAWLDAILRLRRNEALRAQMRADGLLQAARFSWRQSAERYLQTMAGLDGSAAAPDAVAAFPAAAE